MKSTILVSLLVVPVLAGLNVLSAPSVAPAPAVLPCVALSGVDGQIEERSYHRITNQDDWVKLWRKHKGDKSGGEYDFHYDPLGLPLVDFERFMVIALFETPDDCTDGFQAESISEKANEIIIGFQRKGHQTGRVKPFDGPECSDDENPEPVRKAYGFFIVPKSKKMIIMEERLIVVSEVVEAFRFPTLK